MGQSLLSLIGQHFSPLLVRSCGIVSVWPDSSFQLPTGAFSLWWDLLGLLLCFGCGVLVSCELQPVINEWMSESWFLFLMFLPVSCWSSAVWCCPSSPPSPNTRSSPTKDSSSWYASFQHRCFLPRPHPHTSCAVSISACVCVELYADGGTDSRVSRWGGFRCCRLCRKSQTWSTNPNSYSIIPPLLLPPLSSAALGLI